MKKKSFGLLLSILLVLGLMVGSNFVVKQDTYAIGDEVSEDYVDLDLYEALQLTYSTINNCAVPQVLKEDSFVTKIDGTTPITTLDLSDKGISSLDGLQYFDMGNINTLILDNNELTEITATHLYTFSNLTNIYVRNNQLTSIDIKDRKLIAVLDLANNNLEGINLATIDVAYSNINIAYNNIVSVKNIAINNTTQYVINLNFNYLTDIVSTADNVAWDLGVQRQNNYTVSTMFAYYTQDSYDFTLEITDESGNVINKSEDSSFSLSAGEYVFRFKNGEDYVYDENSIATECYKDIAVIVKPDKPIAVIVYKGKEYINYKKTMVGRPNIKVSLVEGVDYFYKIDNGDWKHLDSSIIKLDKYSGNYNVYIKATQNGITSESVGVVLNTSTMSFIPDIVLVVFLILAGVGLLWLMYYLIKKYLY